MFLLAKIQGNKRQIPAKLNWKKAILIKNFKAFLNDSNNNLKQ